MNLREIEPGLYERVDTPRPQDVQISRAFADAVSSSSNSSVLSEILERFVHESVTMTESARVDAQLERHEAVVFTEQAHVTKTPVDPEATVEGSRSATRSTE